MAPSTRPTAKSLAETLESDVMKGAGGEHATDIGLLSAPTIPLNAGATGYNTPGVVFSSQVIGAGFAVHSWQPYNPHQNIQPLPPPSSEAKASSALQVFRPLSASFNATSSEVSSCASDGESENQHPIAPLDWHRPPKVLIVDNKTSLREATKTILEAYGCTVCMASDGVEAMTSCNWSQNPATFDIVFMVRDCRGLGSS